MNIYSCDDYINDLKSVAELDLPWNLLVNSNVMITGATGLIGSFLVDVLMYKNVNHNLNCKVYALGRNREKARERFKDFYNNDTLEFISYDINCPFEDASIKKVDYVLHMASNTHPLQYSTDPIGTITTNIIGLQNMLEFSNKHKVKRFIYTSSNEVYGENRGDVELFDESYCGYIDSNTLRAGYPESKRCGEALCQAYILQKQMNIVIPRVTRTYGPTMLMSDTKALSQFIKKSISGEDIVLKSEGKQYYSYAYVSDTVAGILFVMLKGENGGAYNIADEKSDIKLKDLAGYIASINDKKVIFEIPDKLESKGYSKATKARLNGEKIKKLGWYPKYDIYEGVKHTINILKNIY